MVFWALAQVFRGPIVLVPGSCFQRPTIFWILAHVLRGPMVFWGFGSCFQMTKGSGSWLMFSETWDFRALAHVFSGPNVLDLGSRFQRPWILDLGSCFQSTKGFFGFGSCFQRTKGSRSWLRFLEAQDFWILAHVFRGPRVFWALAHVFRGPKVLDPGPCFQRPKIFGYWLMFRGPRVFWALAHVFRGPKVPDPDSCFQRPRIFGSWLMFSKDQGFFGLWLMFSKDQRF